MHKLGLLFYSIKYLSNNIHKTFTNHPNYVSAYEVIKQTEAKYAK